MLWEFSIFVFTLAFLLFAIFSILYLIQLRRTAKNIEIVLHTLNQSLPGILSKIDGIATDMSDTIRMLKMQVVGVTDSVLKIRDMVDEVFDFERTLRKEIELPVMSTISSFNALLKGVRAFISSLVSPRQQ